MERSFKYDQCIKSFGEKKKVFFFVRHPRKHSGENLLKCGKYDKSFIIDGHLVNCQITHSGVKPSNCDQCDKKIHKQILWFVNRKHIQGRNHLNVTNILKVLP